MNSLKVIVIASYVFLGVVTSAVAEVPAAPVNINPNDHATLASYYEKLAKEVSEKLDTFQQELDEYEDHPYYYGRRGEDLKSHLQANIREYQKELTEDLQEAELHRKIADGNQDRQFNKAEVETNKVMMQ
ncbi:hypothetical protein W03_01230 [Nitrosomonas sp. PY1]|uniref:hypothetical protein n=1 Tax=Nitrosomonas sp. PY1 TaxID=1803906 RepID=UPI001FC8B2FE|nr:hypothetical protein [Nitrosomonas sp. PY1]GKS68119.1 hypothetical protein W03_01230 [Nitrosomonas sp. PY1]